MGMESAKMEEAAKSLALSEAGSRKQMKATKSKTNETLPPGIEWEVVNADSVMLLRKDMHWFQQIIYEIPFDRFGFANLFMTAFPNGLDGH
ncbi:hypothetical protein ARMGADRAFT_1086150 [Armillaria gallica]|uniref:Uncharacterized protein n=1 Tax=Armillaria gallica TaxID=47427 RepID=A0A2H3CZV9_ARMGA|nr:hypothetical protein ARMGADRAFT_1086150 [Armillaria gallica]